MWWFGSVTLEARFYLLVVLLTALTLVTVAVVTDLSQGRVHVRSLPMLLVPFLLMIALGQIQLLEYRSELSSIQLSQFTGAEEYVPSVSLISPYRSFYPAGTQLHLSLITLAAIAFVVGWYLFDTDNDRAFFLGVLVLSGGVFAAIGLVQNTTSNGKLLWHVPLTQGGVPFASFVNRNNAATFLTLCLGASIGFIGWLSSRQGSSLVSDGRSQLRRFAANLTVGHLFVFCCSVLMVIGIIGTNSRGGVLAMIFAGAITCIVPGRSIRKRWLMAGTAGIAVASCTTAYWLGVTDQISRDLTALIDDGLQGEARVAHWSDALQVVPDKPWLGTGLGTYAYSYLPYQSRPSRIWFVHADNLYIETLVETGLVGLCLCLCTVFMVARSCILPDHKQPNMGRIALTTAGTFVLICIAVQSLTDFGLLIPAITANVALFFGGLTARVSNFRSEVTAPALPAKWRPVVPSIMVALIVTGIVMLPNLKSAAAGESAVRDVRVAEKEGLNDSIAQVDYHIERLTQISTERPHDVQVHRVLARLWIRRFQLSTFESSHQLRPDAPALSFDSWRQIQPVSLHTVLVDSKRRGHDATVSEIRRLVRVDDSLSNASRHYRQAIRCCPLVPGARLEFCAISALLESDINTEDLLDGELRVNPSDYHRVFLIGLMAQNLNDPELARICWRQSLAISPRYTREIIDALSAETALSDIMQSVFPPRPEFCLSAAEQLGHSPGRKEQRLEILRYGRQLIRQDSSLSAGDRYALGARFDMASEHPHAAVAAWAKAVELKPRQVEWRFELAKSMREAGRLNEAITEAQTCVALSPGVPAYRDFMVSLEAEQLSRSLRRRQFNNGVGSEN